MIAKLKTTTDITQHMVSLGLQFATAQYM